MTACRLCTLDDDTIELETRRGTLYACRKCLADLLDDELDRVEQAEHNHCATCIHYTVDGHCTQGLTPRTCC